MTSSTEKCNTCGTTRLRFDPPLVFEATEACGAIRPGNYATAQPIPACLLEKGHEGKHFDLVEYEVRW